MTASGCSDLTRDVLPLVNSTAASTPTHRRFGELWAVPVSTRSHCDENGSAITPASTGNRAKSARSDRHLEEHATTHGNNRQAAPLRPVDSGTAADAGMPSPATFR